MRAKEKQLQETLQIKDQVSLYQVLVKSISIIGKSGSRLELKTRHKYWKVVTKGEYETRLKMYALRLSNLILKQDTWWDGEADNSHYDGSRVEYFPTKR